MEGTATRTSPADTTKLQLWAGRILSGLAILFFVVDGGFKVLQPQMIAEMTPASLGWPPNTGLIVLLGSLLLISTALYAYPRTSVLGAILLTGYLGGAIATHLRVSDPVFTHTLFGAYFGVAVWAGLWFRNPRLRALIPLSA
jgi:hypothetical protein